MDKSNILNNEAAMQILRTASNSLKEIGVHCILAPMSLPQGMTISLHVGVTEIEAMAASVAATHGGLAAHSSDMHKQFSAELAFALTDNAILKASSTPE